MAWRDPLGLDRYLWLLMLNRHGVDYQHISPNLMANCVGPNPRWIAMRQGCKREPLQLS